MAQKFRAFSTEKQNGTHPFCTPKILENRYSATATSQHLFYQHRTRQKSTGFDKEARRFYSWQVFFAETLIRPQSSSRLSAAISAVTIWAKFPSAWKTRYLPPLLGISNGIGKPTNKFLANEKYMGRGLLQKHQCRQFTN